MAAGEQGWEWAAPSVLAPGSESKPLSLDQKPAKSSFSLAVWSSLPPSPEEGCCAPELEKRSSVVSVSRVQCLRRCQRRKGWRAGPGCSRRPFVGSLGVYPKVKEVPAKTELCFQTDCRSSGVSLLGNTKASPTQP